VNCRTSFVLWLLLLMAVAQASSQTVDDPFDRRISEVKLVDQTVIDGFAIVSGMTGLPVSVEHALGTTISQPSPTAKKLSATVPPGKTSEVLDRLCDLDTAFTWIRIGNMVNLVPRVLISDQNYLLNKKVERLMFNGIPDGQEAVFHVVNSLPGPKEQIAVFQPSMSLTFSRPWTAEYTQTTVRELFDKIAQQFGPSYGWQFSGAQDFRTITFHQSIRPKAPPPKGATGGGGRPSG
jgi:hypothetical protein